MKTSILLDRNSFARAEEELHNDHRGLEELAAPLTAAKGLPALLCAAEELHEAMILHFAHEERPGGLCDSLKFCVPQHSGDLAELVGAHHDIAVAVSQLCQRAHDPKANLQALRREAVQIIQKFQRHETHEHEMARQALGKGPRRGKP